MGATSPNGMAVAMVSYVRSLTVRMLSERKNAVLHWHFSMASDPGSALVLGGHAMHALELGACGVTEKVLAAQSMHADAPCHEYAPVGHGTHVEGSDAPLTAEAVPLGHLTHWLVLMNWPVDICEYVPGPQSSACSWVSTVCGIMLRMPVLMPTFLAAVCRLVIFTVGVGESGSGLISICMSANWDDAG